jgi:hypothetical protein
MLLGTCCAAQELIGTDCVLPGRLASFEIVPVQEASWVVVTPSSNTEKYQVDTGSSKLYFASPEQGRYTIIAGIVVDGKPNLLVKTFLNGGEDTRPLPIPVPPVSSLETWVKTQTPLLVKSKNIMSESRLVADCFEQIVRRIDGANIKTTQNAQAQLQIALTATLAQSSPTALTDWLPFLVELSRRLESELGENLDNLTEVKKRLQHVNDALKSLDPPKNMATLQSVDDPVIRIPNTPRTVRRR